MTDKPITWKKLGRGHYWNPETGVEIKFGWDRLPEWRSSNEAWFIYEPQPYDDLRRVAGWQLKLRDAQQHEGNDLVASMRIALSDPEFERVWAKWREKIEAQGGTPVRPPVQFRKDPPGSWPDEPDFPYGERP